MFILKISRTSLNQGKLQKLAQQVRSYKTLLITLCVLFIKNRLKRHGGWKKKRRSKKQRLRRRQRKPRSVYLPVKCFELKQTNIHSLMTRYSQLFVNLLPQCRWLIRRIALHLCVHPSDCLSCFRVYLISFVLWLVFIKLASNVQCIETMFRRCESIIPTQGIGLI